MKQFWKIFALVALLAGLTVAFVVSKPSAEPVQAADPTVAPTFAIYTNGTIERIYEDQFEIFYLDKLGGNRIVLNKATGSQKIYCPCASGWCLLADATPYPTATLTAAATSTVTITPGGPTATSTATLRPGEPTNTLAPTFTSTPTSVNTSTLVPTFTSTPTLIPTNTLVPSNTPIPTFTPTLTSTSTPVPAGNWYTHLNANGTALWTRCLTPDEAKGHQENGHSGRDIKGDPCTP